jgi:hypothetical protein
VSRRFVALTTEKLAEHQSLYVLLDELLGEVPR